MKKLNINNLKKSDDAVVGIIVAVLLIGLVLVVISIVQTIFIPNWMENIEADHMDEVAQQFSQLKFAIDIQSVLNTTDLPVSVPVTIGSKAFPLLQSSQSFGSLNIIEDSCIFSIGNSSLENIQLGTIIFSSYNSYFLNQDYIYESGSIIVNQDDGNIMTIKPDITLAVLGNDIYIDLNLINISKIGNKGSASGYGTYPIRVEYNGIQNNLSDFTGAENITITSSFSEAWRLYFKSLLNKYGISDDSLSSDTNKFIIDFSILKNEVPNIHIDLKTNIIDAQIAPGWIEDTI